MWCLGLSYKHPTIRILNNIHNVVWFQSIFSFSYCQPRATSIAQATRCHKWNLTGNIHKYGEKQRWSEYLKKGETKTEASSYRPISMTNCLVKVLDMIINTRLKWFLESEQLLASEKAGFREHQCTHDQTTYLAHEIEDGIQHKKHTLTVWIDLQKAFDKVWTDGLILKLKKSNIARNLFRWIKSYLHNLRARDTSPAP